MGLLYLFLHPYVRLGLPIDLFVSGFPTQTPYPFLLFLPCSTCPPPPPGVIILDFIMRIFGEKYKS